MSLLQNALSGPPHRSAAAQKIVRGFLGISILAHCLISLEAAKAQVGDDVAVGTETVSSDFFGVDARAMSMGNTGLALPLNGAALVYNPAGMAGVKRLEFRAGFSHLRSTGISTVLYGAEPSEEHQNINRTRINALSLMFPIPTYRGSMVVGLGIHRVGSYDRTLGRNWVESFENVFYGDSARTLESGSLWKWSGGLAVDISPRISTGFSLHVLSGGDEFRGDGQSSISRFYESPDRYVDTISVFEQSGDINYLGLAGTAGLRWNVSEQVGFGLTVESPTYLAAEETTVLSRYFYEITDTVNSAFFWEKFLAESTTVFIPNYNLTRPLAVGVGACVSMRQFNIAVDLRYMDWTQLGFNYDNPDLDPGLEEDESRILRFIQDEMSDVLSVATGVEYILPQYGLSFRAGYLRDPVPVNARYIEKQRQYVTAGVGFLIDRIMTLDIAYVHGGYELRDDDPGTYNAEYKTRRLFATFGYRI